MERETLNQRIYSMLHPSQSIPAIPEQTAQVAQAAFPKGNIYLQMRDALGSLYDDKLFATLYGNRGQPAAPPWRLALVSIMQFMENLSDRQAAEAVRSRIDWKYALSLELTDSGFDFSVLSEFRSRLISGGQEAQLLNHLLEQCQAKGWLKARGKQRTDSTHVVTAARTVNRCECVGETLRHALNVLATVATDWLEQRIEPEWFERYSVRVEASRLPQKREDQKQWLQQVGIDGHVLLAQIYEENTPHWLQQIPAVEILRQVWVQHYYIEANQVLVRQSEQTPPNHQQIETPYDLEARNRTKRSLNWTGYCVHLSETCEDDLPNLITNVETTLSTVVDVEMTASIHQHLAQKELLPSEHFLDAGYINSEHLVTLEMNSNVKIVGPVPADNSWQAQADSGFDLTHFTIDWQQQQVQCPQGQLSQRWSETVDARKQAVIHVHFRRQQCDACPCQSLCTRSTSSGYGRTLKLLPQPQHQALQAARHYQTTDEFRQRYARRAGVEGTLSQGTRAFGLRRSRYIGLAKAHLQHVFTAVAMNLARLMNWWQRIPKAQTRTSRFASLNPEAQLC
jgi:transposase